MCSDFETRPLLLRASVCSSLCSYRNELKKRSVSRTKRLPAIGCGRWHELVLHNRKSHPAL
jgi:hypothetical protein